MQHAPMKFYVYKDGVDFEVPAEITEKTRRAAAHPPADRGG